MKIYVDNKQIEVNYSGLTRLFKIYILGPSHIIKGVKLINFLNLHDPADIPDLEPLRGYKTKCLQGKDWAILKALEYDIKTNKIIVKITDLQLLLQILQIPYVHIQITLKNADGEYDDQLFKSLGPEYFANPLAMYNMYQSSAWVGEISDDTQIYSLTVNPTDSLSMVHDSLKELVGDSVYIKTVDPMFNDEFRTMNASRVKVKEVNDGNLYLSVFFTNPNITQLTIGGNVNIILDDEETLNTNRTLTYFAAKNISKEHLDKINAIVRRNNDLSRFARVKPIYNTQF